MVLGDAVSKLETFVWILNHISRSITWSLFTLKASYFKQDALGSVTGLHYDSKYFRIAKENSELRMVSGSLNITMICLRFN